jgi:predicted  nucleic acid-binding Zn-ribbon protein
VKHIHTKAAEWCTTTTHHDHACAAEMEEQQQHYQEQHNTQQQTSTEVQAQVSECVAAVKADDSAREQNIGTLTTGKNEESLPLYRRIVNKKNESSL